MVVSTMLGIFDWIGDFFKALFDLIPKVIYLLYASLACLLDVLQLFFRKLAGLDVYYVDGVAQTGDLVTNFIGGILGIHINNTAATKYPYSALSNVFWAMLVFGIIICFISVFVAIIKAHYSYDGKTTPIQIVYTGGKAIINMIAVPIIVLLGLFVSQALLTALDSITSVTTGSVVEEFGSSIQYFKPVDTVQTATGKSTEKTYLYYDIFGFGGAIAYGDVSETVKAWTSDDMKNFALIGAKNQTFSGSLFKTAAYNANRARLGQYSITGDEFAGQKDWFSNAKTDAKLADLIDTAFANNMALNEPKWLVNWTRVSSKTYFTNFTVSWLNRFSKFNVGAVWYYYDLWQFNFVVGFAAVIVCSTLFINIIFGLMTRLLMCVVLFLIAPPLFGLAPIKDAGKGWRENFIKQAIMAFGAVVGMNLVMMILPFLNSINFFNIPIADYLVRILFIVVALITIKAVIETVSGLVGGADANATGDKIAGDVGKTMLKAGKLTTAGAAAGTALTGAAFLGTAGLAGGAINLGLAGKNKIQQKYNDARAKSKKRKTSERVGKGIDYTKNARAVQKAEGGAVADTAKDIEKGVDRDKTINRLTASGMSQDEAERVYNSASDFISSGGKTDGMNNDEIKQKVFKTETHKVHEQRVEADKTRNKSRKLDKRVDKRAEKVRRYSANAKQDRGIARTSIFGGVKKVFSTFMGGMKDGYSDGKFVGAYTDDIKNKATKQEEKEYKKSVVRSLQKTSGEEEENKRKQEEMKQKKEEEKRRKKQDKKNK